MSDKECEDHISERRKLAGRLLSGALISGFLIVLIVWVILQPQKPTFTLQDVTIFGLNASAPDAISSALQVTVSCRNDNSIVGVYYDKMDVYTAYRGQQITRFTALPPAYQGTRDVDVWSPFLYGNDVPVGVALGQDQAYGVVPLTIKINGQVRWKVGSLVTGRYHLHVTCPAYIPVGSSGNSGVVIGSGVKYQLSQSCTCSVGV